MVSLPDELLAAIDTEAKRRSTSRNALFVAADRAARR
jgi:metal-responsive CopG/Arc/MetJ family transcriptional regulator